VLALVELRLGENVVHLQPVHVAKQVSLERQACAPVPRRAHARQQVEYRIEACAETPAREVTRLGAQAAMPKAKLLQQLIEAAVRAFEGGQVLIDERFG
jgi:hypothetical protein